MSEERIRELEEENRKLRERIARLEQDHSTYKDELERISWQADQDFLTGLYNRNAIHRMIEERLVKEPDQAGALCFLDLDNFKQVNDRFGHSYGDEALRAVARLICESVSETDVAGRFGGDEFLIFMKEIEGEEDVLRRARQICDRIREESPARGQTASVGVALYPRDGVFFQELLEAADTALYKSKCAGKDRVCFCSME